MSPPPPYIRRLKCYAFDPLASADLRTADVNLVTLEVRWEADLRPGPVGEYLEVIDQLPGEDRPVPGVDLNDPHYLATDGVTPSETNYQFHQQMVYVVGMKTIAHFERALGRPVIWSSRFIRRPGRGVREVYTPRLKVYPHGLREANAFYNPYTKELKFGVFVASADSRRQMPGSRVFTCLAYDVVAHETAHALLDGVHRYFTTGRHPDVPAFHEAFADLIALFQHFTHADVLRQQIAAGRGDVAAGGWLANLARQFGEAIDGRESLRAVVGEKTPDPEKYRTVREPHERGGLLVAAVFQAFLTIYAARVEDLLRIATNGRGVPEPGALHPDLVNRMAHEAAKSAGHVMTMCIRSLDYLPPVEPNFGDFLRALITADTVLVPDDTRHYRLAIIDAFRQWGLYPRDVSTLSEASLRWRGPSAEERDLIGRLPDAWWAIIDPAEALTWQAGPGVDRGRVWSGMRRGRARLHAAISDALDGKVVGLTPRRMRQLGAAFGLDLSGGDPFEVHAIRPCVRVGPDGQVVIDYVVSITQRVPDRLRPAIQPPPPEHRWPRGGCTMILDGRERAVRYIVSKKVTSPARWCAYDSPDDWYPTDNGLADDVLRGLTT